MTNTNTYPLSSVDAVEQTYCEQCRLGGFMRRLCPVTCTVAQMMYRQCQAHDALVVTIKREMQ